MEEVELKYLPKSEPDKNKQEFIVNREINCFLCLNNYNYTDHQNNRANSLSPDKNDGNVSLLRVCRYLKLDCSNILSESPDLLLLLTENNSSPVVTICPECTPIFETLSTVLEQFELQQMKVDFALGQFRNILKDAEDDKNIYQDFRVELIKKCNKSLNSVLPKVVVEAIQNKQNPVTPKSYVKPPRSPLQPPPAALESDKILLPVRPTIPKKSNALKCNDCRTTFTHKRHLQTHRRNFHGETKEYYCLRCHTKFNKRTNFIHHRNYTCPSLPPGVSKGCPPPGYRACRICRPSKTICANNWHRHNIRFHIETFFKSTQVPGLSPENFKNYCEHVFRMQQNSAQKIPNSDYTMSRKCGHCTATFINQIGLRTHLVKDHKTVIANLVIAAQKKIGLEQIEEEKNRHRFHYPHYKKKAVPDKLENDDSNIKFYTCTLCQPNRRITLWSKSRHDAHFHADVIFATARNENVSEPDFKHYCEHLFKTEIQSFRRVPNVNYVNAQPRIECGHCRRICCDRSSTRNHLSVSHQDILSEKLASLQKTVGLEEIVQKEKVVMGSKKATKGNLKYEQMGKKCKHCRRMFSTEANLRRHLHNVHQVEVQKCGAKPSTKISGNGNEVAEKMEIVQDNFEQSALFVTKVDVSSCLDNVVNYVEMEITGNEETNCDEEYFAENEEEPFDTEIVPDKDPLEI